MNEVITLAATKSKTATAGVKPSTLDVAAYARVSTDNLEQKTSYAAQISEYTERINSNPLWNMVGIYADEGLSATSMKKRDDFLRLLRDCRAGLIDLVLVKSISRFARNVEDSIHTVKELRAYGVDVFFEKENLHSIDPANDVIFTILATFAQQESVSIGQNVKWGLRKKMKDGGLVGGTNQILGFDYADGNYTINEQEAETVRRIFHLYLHGKGYQSIANILEKEGHTTSNGTKLWNRRTIQGVICNEKYYGALLSQKTIVDDFLKHTRKVNRGDEDQYYIENHHPAIILKETFDLAAKERERRAKVAHGVDPDRSNFTVRYAFSERLVCDHCGNTLKRVHRTNGVGWRCPPKLHGQKVCTAQTVNNSTLERAFIDVYNSIVADESNFFQGFIRSVERVVSKREEKCDVRFLEKKVADLDEQMKELVRMKLRKEIDEQYYNAAYQDLKNELNEAKGQREKFYDTELMAAEQNQKLAEIREVIHSRNNTLNSFDEDLFIALVEKVVVRSKTDFTFILVNGEEIIFDASAYAVEDGRGKWRNRKKEITQHEIDY